jgi:antitoxin component of MazEF toxin-antitoxin module
MTGLIRFQRTLRRAGGTIAVTIPPEIQKALGLKAGQRVDIYITDERRMIIELKK